MTFMKLPVTILREKVSFVSGFILNVFISALLYVRKEEERVKQSFENCSLLYYTIVNDFFFISHSTNNQ